MPPLDVGEYDKDNHVMIMIIIEDAKLDVFFRLGGAAPAWQSAVYVFSSDASAGGANFCKVSVDQLCDPAGGLSSLYMISATAGQKGQEFRA